MSIIKLKYRIKFVHECTLIRSLISILFTDQTMNLRDILQIIQAFLVNCAVRLVFCQLIILTFLVNSNFLLTISTVGGVSPLG